jgi:Raf kinase inhibitor-like YbhB/YbcL family protein
MIPPPNFQLLSTAFLDDADIPQRFTCHDLDISPALAWSRPPAGTKSFALIVEDPDAPSGAFTHWLVYNLPPTTAGISENFPKSPSLPDGTLQGRNDFGRIGYSGPCPPTGKAHKYVFKIHALNSVLKCKPGASRTDLANAMRGHVVETAQLAARYQTSPQAGAVADDEDPIMKAEKSRLDALGKNPDYLIKTHKLQEELKKAYSINRLTVKEFFRTVAFFRRPAKVQESLNAIDDRGVRRTLEDYLTYADRYRVYFRLRTDPLEFEPRAWPQYGVKFHGKVVDDHLQPLNLPFVPDDDDSIIEYFSADDLDLPPEIKKLVDAGKATFFRIDEKESYSILRQLEDIALKDEGVAIIEHNAEQPYFIIICGPKMNKPLLADLGPALTEFQREHYDESYGGRRRDVERLKRDLEAEEEPTSKKGKAVDSVGTDEKKLNAEQVRKAKLRKEIRRTKI